MIHFQSPLWACGFFLVLFSALVLVVGQSLRRKRYDRLIQNDLQASMTLRPQHGKETLFRVCDLAALALLILALMRPQWGNRWEHVKKQGYDILFAVDVSKSMLAQDIKPNRLERTKLAVGDFIHRQEGDRIGIIAFAGDAFLVCPLTSDHEIVQMVLNDLSPKSVSAPGTALAAAIQEAIRATRDGGNNPRKILFLISDGEDQEGHVMEAAQEANKDDIRIYTLGVGSPEGELITIVAPDGHSEYLKDNEGRVVKSRMDESALKQIAKITGGVYRRSSPIDFGLESLYNKATEDFKKTDYSETNMQRRTERFQIFLILALILFFAEIFLNRARTTQPHE